jgi:hypothetical protein
MDKVHVIRHKVLVEGQVSERRSAWRVTEAKELSHFGKPVLVCRNLEEYIWLNAT